MFVRAGRVVSGRCLWTLGAVGRRRRWQRGLWAMKPDPAAVVRVRRAARRGFAGRLIRFQPRCWLPARPRCAAVRRGAAPHNGVRQLEGESHPQAAPRCDPPLRLCGGADPVHRQAKALPPRPRQALLRPRRCRRPRPGRRGGGAPRCGLSGAGQGRAAGRGGAARALFSAHTLCAAHSRRAGAGTCPLESFLLERSREWRARFWPP